MNVTWLPKRLATHTTSAHDWYLLLVELGERTVLAIRQENPYGRFPR